MMMIALLIVHDNVHLKIFSFKTGKICHGFLNEKSSPFGTSLGPLNVDCM